MQILREGELAHAVHNTEVDCLGLLAQFQRDLGGRNAKDPRGGIGVDVKPRHKGLSHSAVPRNVRKQAQLDLGIVGVNEHASRLGGNKELPELSTKLRTDGNILQVRLSRGETAGSCTGLLEGGMHHALLVGQLQKAIHIGRLEFRDLTVVKDIVNNGVITAELLQHLCVRGIARLGLFIRGKKKNVKEDLAKLLGRIDIKGAAGIGVNTRLHICGHRVQHLPIGGDGSTVDLEPHGLHVGKNGA